MGRELRGGRGGVERKWRELVERENGERAREVEEWEEWGRELGERERERARGEGGERARGEGEWGES